MDSFKFWMSTKIYGNKPCVYKARAFKKKGIDKFPKVCYN